MVRTRSLGFQGAHLLLSCFLSLSSDHKEIGRSLSFFLLRSLKREKESKIVIVVYFFPSYYYTRLGKSVCAEKVEP